MSSEDEDASIVHAREIARSAHPGFQLELAKAYLAAVIAQVDRKRKREQDEQRERGVR